MHQHVIVLYFAQLKEKAQKLEEQLPLEAGDTAGTIYGRLAERYHFPMGLRDVRVAINDEFASIDRILVAGDRLAFIPPVSGG